MGTYGRNFEFRVPPVHGQRQSRFASPDAVLPIGVPVRAPDGSSDNALGLLPVELATGAQAPVKGLSGIVLYEHAPAAYAGFDPVVTTYSDIDTVPKNKACQVISGDAVKVVFRNTVDRTFMTARDYAGRTMVAGLGATPTLAVGDFLTPGAGNDDDGYWDVTTDPTEAWLVVERIEAARGEVEARLAF